MGLLSLVTKSINATNVPIRVKFKLPVTLQANLGKVTLKLPAGEYVYTGGNRIGYFRTYNTDFDFTQIEASAISVGGSVSVGWTFVVTTSVDLDPNKLHEVIIITDRVPLSDANFAQLSVDGKVLTATFDNNGVLFAKDTIRIFKYQMTPVIMMSGFYYTSKYANDANILIFTLNLNSDITAFPTSRIEIQLPSASATIIKSGFTTATRQLMCGVTLSARSSSTAAAPRCILVHSEKPKIRIENYPAYTAGTVFNIIIYDLLNTVIPQDAVAYFDAVVVYTDVNTKLRSERKLTRAFTTSTGSAGPLSSSIGTATTSSPNFAAVTTLSKSLVWATSDCDPCRIVIRSSGSDWKFQDFDFQIDGSSQGILLDFANNAFSKCLLFYYFLTFSVDLSAPSLSVGATYKFDFTGTSFTNPLPYETNSDTFTIQTIVNNQHHQILALSLPYASLVAADFTGTSSYCSAINSRLTGANGGNVACYLTIPLSSSLVNNIAAIQIDFIAPSQFSEIYPFCGAEVASGATTVPGGQMTCSRIDLAANSPSIRLSGFSFSSGSTVRVYFRARVKTTTLATNIYLQVLQNNNYYAMHKQIGYNIDLSGGTTSACKLFLKQHEINFS